MEKTTGATIPAFFNGRSIFVTGATGFMGKVLIEKLLRSCPGIDEIYLLMRPKKGLNIDERLKKILANKVNIIFLVLYISCICFFVKLFLLQLFKCYTYSGNYLHWETPYQ